MSWRSQERAVGYGLILPDAVGLILFVVGPMIVALILSFTSWSGLSSPTFIGTKNYATLLGDPVFLGSLVTTTVFVIAYVSGLYLLSLGLALLVNQRLSATGFFRSGYFLAAMVSPAVAAIIWSFIFGERSGIINSLLGAVGIAPLRWLGSPSLALAVIAVVAIWQASSYAMIIQLAGLQDIPREYYEAAHVDGAGAWTTFRHITIPLLKPTTTFVVITALIDGFQIFDIIFVMTRGGPAHGTTSTVFLIFQNAFQFFKIGYASAMAVVLFAIIFGFSILLLRLFRQQSLA